jgi:hypothetical protein
VGNASTVASQTITATAGPQWDCEAADTGAYPSSCIADDDAPMDDADGDSNVTLEPVEGDDVQARSTGPINQRFRVRVRTSAGENYGDPFDRWSSVRTGPNSWVIGQTPDNSIVDGEYQDDTHVSGNPKHAVTWVLGFVGGFSGGARDTPGCGWVYNKQLAGGLRDRRPRDVRQRRDADPGLQLEDQLPARHPRHPGPGRSRPPEALLQPRHGHDARRGHPGLCQHRLGRPWQQHGLCRQRAQQRR